MFYLLLALLNANSWATMDAPKITMGDGEVSIARANRTYLRIKVGKKDEVKPLGHCLLIRRNLRKTDLLPEVDSAEVYTMTGKKRPIQNVNPRQLQGNVFSAGYNWAVMMNEEEGKIFGYFFFDQACDLHPVLFEKALYWGDTLGKSKTVGNDQLLFPGLGYDMGMKKKANLVIHSNQKYEITSVP